MDIVELLRKSNENSFLIRSLDLKLVIFFGEVAEFQTAHKNGECDQSKVRRGQKGER